MLFCGFDLEKYVKTVLQPDLKREDLAYLGSRSPLLSLEDKLRDYHKKKKRSNKLFLTKQSSILEDELFLEKKKIGSVTDLGGKYFSFDGVRYDIGNLIDEAVLTQQEVLHQRAEDTISLLQSVEPELERLIFEGESLIRNRRNALRPSNIQNLLRDLQKARMDLELQMAQDRRAEIKLKLLESQRKEVEDKFQTAKADKQGKVPGTALGSVTELQDNKKKPETAANLAKPLKDATVVQSKESLFSEVKPFEVKPSQTSLSRAASYSTDRAHRLNTGLKKYPTQIETVDMDESSMSVRNMQDQSEDDSVKNAHDYDRGSRRGKPSRRQSILNLQHKGSIEYADDLNKRFANNSRPRRMSSLRGTINYNDEDVEDLFSSSSKGHIVGGFAKRNLFRQISIREHSKLDQSIDFSIDDLGGSSKAFKDWVNTNKDLQSSRPSRISSSKNNITADNLKNISEEMTAIAVSKALQDEQLGKISREVLLDVLKKKNLRLHHDLSKASNLVITSEEGNNVLSKIRSKMVDYLKTKKIEIIRDIIYENKIYKMLYTSVANERKIKEIDRQLKLRDKVKKIKPLDVRIPTVNIFQEVEEQIRAAVTDCLQNELPIAEESPSSRPSNIMFSRTNQRLRFELMKNSQLQGELQRFIAVWLADHIGIEKATDLQLDPVKRAEFFANKPALLQLAIDAMCLRPSIYRMATEVMYDKSPADDITFSPGNFSDTQKFAQLKEVATPFKLVAPSRMRPALKERPKRHDSEVKTITENYSVVNINFDHQPTVQKSQSKQTSSFRVTQAGESFRRLRKANNDLSDTRGLGVSMSSVSIGIGPQNLLQLSANGIVPPRLGKVLPQEQSLRSKDTTLYESVRSKLLTKNIQLPTIDHPRERKMTLEERMIFGRPASPRVLAALRRALISGGPLEPRAERRAGHRLPPQHRLLRQAPAHPHERQERQMRLDLGRYSGSPLLIARRRAGKDRGRRRAAGTSSGLLPLGVAPRLRQAVVSHDSSV